MQSPNQTLEVQKLFVDHLRRAERDPHVLRDSVIEKLVDEADETDPEMDSLTLGALAKCIKTSSQTEASDRRYSGQCNPPEIAERLGWGVTSPCPVPVRLMERNGKLRGKHGRA